MIFMSLAAGQSVEELTLSQLFYSSVPWYLYLNRSKGHNGTSIYRLFWDDIGEYGVKNDAPGSLNKHLTLDYDFLGKDYFDLYVIEDQPIELFRRSSGTTYEFKGRSFIQYEARLLISPGNWM